MCLCIDIQSVLPLTENVHVTDYWEDLAAEGHVEEGGHSVVEGKPLHTMNVLQEGTPHREQESNLTCDSVESPLRQVMLQRHDTAQNLDVITKEGMLINNIFFSTLFFCLYLYLPIYLSIYIALMPRSLW